jgi:hypothetical protein
MSTMTRDAVRGIGLRRLGVSGGIGADHERSEPTCPDPSSIGLRFVCPARVSGPIGELLLAMPGVVFLYS